MKSRFTHLAAMACAIFAVGSFSSPARAQVIIDDSFDSGSSLQSVQGLAPQVTNLPGGTYNVSNSAGGGNNFFALLDTPAFGGPATSLFIWGQGDSLGGDATIPIASAGAYTKPSQFTISSDFLLTSFSAGTPGEGVLLGFYSVAAIPAATDSPLDGFTGLSFSTTGALSLVENGTVTDTEAFTGTFSTTGFNTLSYTVDTATGNISNVSLAGNTAYTFSSTAFDDASTAFAALGVSNTNHDTFGYADNFTVTGIVVATPEPSTCALMLGSLGLLAFWPRRAHRA